ncbi:hypothetical protein M885DRAFT_551726 [Pelagophyceae sp. CCMP2097]|nr:hypothetical protein M885DRAFT_551726 [Pelagophyceae sp. CCMP2097]
MVEEASALPPPAAVSAPPLWKVSDAAQRAQWADAFGDVFGRAPERERDQDWRGFSAFRAVPDDGDGYARALTVLRGGGRPRGAGAGGAMAAVERATSTAAAAPADGAPALSTLLTPAASWRVGGARAGPHVGYVVDGALSDSFLGALDDVRRGRPLDASTKRTDAARRFFADDAGWVRAALEHALEGGIAAAATADAGAPTAVRPRVRVLPFMRFLEYLVPAGSLPRHTDAVVQCKSSGEWSTHTLLVYTADCTHGGETALLADAAAPAKASRQRAARRARVFDQASGVRAALGSLRAKRADADGETDAAHFKRKARRLVEALEALEAEHAGLDVPPPEADAPDAAVRPARGRIFCFPHACPHEGRPTIDVPKVVLRAEMILSWAQADPSADEQRRRPAQAE